MKYKVLVCQVETFVKRI